MTGTTEGRRGEEKVLLRTSQGDVLRMSYFYRQSSFVTSECQGEVHNLVKYKQCPSFMLLVLD